MKFKVKNKLKYAYMEAIKIALDLLDNPNNLMVNKTVGYQEEKEAVDVKIKSNRKSTNRVWAYSCNTESMDSELFMVERDIMSNRSEEVDGGGDMENGVLVNEVAKDGSRQDVIEIQEFLNEHSAEDVEKRLETLTKLPTKLMELECGDVVWARMRGYPWWPAVLAPCPSVGKWKVQIGEKVKFHCIFLAWNTERAWLPENEYK